MDIQFNGRTGEQISSDINQKFGEIEQIVNDAEIGALASAEAALTSESAAAQSAADAEAAQVAAEAARDAINTTGKVFTAAEGTAAGIAATTNGQQFSVLSLDLKSWGVYRNNAGSALYLTSSYTGDYFDGLITRRDTRTGRLGVIKDAAGKMAAWWDDAGDMFLGVIGNISTIIAALNAAVKVTSTRGRYAVLLAKDSAGKVALGVDSAGDLIHQGNNVSPVLNLTTFAASQAQLFPTSTIDGFGDSLTQGAGSTGGQTLAVQLAALYTAAGAPRTVALSGLGGQGSVSILARQGSAPAMVTFPVGASGFPEIPASGSVNVTVTNNPLVYPGDPASATSMACTIAGVSGTLNRASGNSGGQYSFARTTSGSIVKVDALAPAWPTFGTQGFGMSLCWLGTNDLIGGASAATILGYIDTYVGFQRPSQKRCIVIMPLFDSSSGSVATFKATYAALLVLVKAKYAFNCIDTLSILQRANDGSGNDLADVAAGLVPRSLTAVDRLHLNNAGYGVVAAAIKSLNDSKGW